MWSELCTVCRNYYTDFSHYSSRDEPKGASCSVPSKMPEDLLNRLGRGHYHRAATRAVMVGHHLEFLNTASVPQGLQLTLRPQVYAADTSPVDSEISEILTTAQSNIISALCKHYSSLQATSTNKKQTVLAEMSSLLSPSSSLSPTEIEEHKEIMKKTENNLKKKMATLADRAHKKLERPPQDKTHTQDFHTTGPRTTTATHTVPRERRTATLNQLSLPSPHPTYPPTPQMQPQTTTKNPDPRKNRKLNHHHPTRHSSPRPLMIPRPLSYHHPIQTLHITCLFSPLRSLPITAPPSSHHHHHAPS